MTKIENLCPHPIDIYSGGKVVLTLPPVKGKTIRIQNVSQIVDILRLGDLSVQVEEMEYGGIVQVDHETQEVTEKGLPEKVEGTFYLMSRMSGKRAKEQFPDRNDLLIPGQEERDADGNIIGLRTFSRPSTFG
jgi:hypothetical protein